MNITLGPRVGIWFEDVYDGRTFINCHVNGGVFNLGHRNPDVLAAVRTALEHVDIGNHHFVSELRTRLAERLAATTGGAASTRARARASACSTVLAMKTPAVRPAGAAWT